MTTTKGVIARLAVFAGAICLLFAFPGQPEAEVREPAVAGMFYPGDEQELAIQVDRFLRGTPAGLDGKILGIMAPHAGYVYSGKTAGIGFRTIRGRTFANVILIGPAHRKSPATGISIGTYSAYRTPLGEVPVNIDFANRLKARDKRFRFDASAHRHEHSLEVEIPFLQRALTGKFSITPILIGWVDGHEILSEWGKIISEEIKRSKKPTLIVLSTDLSHYPPSGRAESLDGKTLKAVLSMDPERVFRDTSSEATKRNDVDTLMCGRMAVTLGMYIMKELGVNRAVQLDYSHSGMAPGADKNRTVGYGAVVFTAVVAAQPESGPLGAKGKDAAVAKTLEGDVPGMNEKQLTEEQKKILLDLARSTVKNYVTEDVKPDFESDDPDFQERRGVFVTLKKAGKLRGCIGNFFADGPLFREVIDMAVAAATRDPRFPPVKPDEVDQLHIEISALTPLREITDVTEIRVGVHGIYITQGFNRGVLLPQVATEYGWDRDEFLDRTCLKAGMRRGCWREPETKIEIFSAEVFSEAKTPAE